MATPSNDIFGVNGSEIKKLPDQELLTHFETLASSSAKGADRDTSETLSAKKSCSA